jgi:hypothetical protein
MHGCVHPARAVHCRCCGTCGACQQDPQQQQQQQQVLPAPATSHGLSAAPNQAAAVYPSCQQDSCCRWNNQQQD